MAIPTNADGTADAKSSHVSDSSLRPLLQPKFDPADYLNATLPSLSLSSVSRSSKQGSSVPLADLSSQTQDLLSLLNAHTTRLSTVLTQLTDDILRSGARLAYEVEVLRGETIGLSETLTDGLKSDVERFLPGGLSLDDQKERSKAPPSTSSEPDSKEEQDQDQDQEEQKQKEEEEENASTPTSTTPEYITQLRTLTLVRSRLESVIKVFGDAMQWTLPPSEVSLASSLISVSAPEPGSDSHSREEKGREFAENLRSEISDLVLNGGSSSTTTTTEGQEVSGSEAAMIRIQALRDLAGVWKGTAEEKARGKFVEGLVRLAEEKQRGIENAASQKQRAGGRGGNAQRPPPPPQKNSSGFLDNIARLRGNIYLE